jgi:tol-pal system protein YbgF
VTPRHAPLPALVLAATLGLTGCASVPAGEDPTQIKLNDLDVRLTRMERALQNQGQVQLGNQLEALRADVRAMHNDVDQLSNSLEASRKQQRDLYADLDQRMKALETHGGGAAGIDAAGAAGGGGDDKSVYQSAFNLLKDGQYDRAVVAFQGFLGTYPTSPLADNAQYWMGEAYYVNKSFTEAQVAFQRVVDKYPQSKKIPDALLKIGFCRYESKQFDSARSVLQQVITQYPDAPAAKLARERLDRITAEKH